MYYQEHPKLQSNFHSQSRANINYLASAMNLPYFDEELYHEYEQSQNLEDSVSILLNFASQFHEIE